MMKKLYNIFSKRERLIGKLQKEKHKTQIQHSDKHHSLENKLDIRITITQ